MDLDLFRDRRNLSLVCAAWYDVVTEISVEYMYIHYEDSTFHFIGYETIPWCLWACRIYCVFTFGIVGLLGHWFPYRWITREKAFILAKMLLLLFERWRVTE
jgi:cation-transporting ATPase 13A3/4/5